MTRGASVNAKSTAGMTALMVAAVHNNPAMIGVLAQLGADLSAKETGGRTARELAVLNDNQAAAQILDVLAATTAQSRNAPIRPQVTRGKNSLNHRVEFPFPYLYGRSGRRIGLER